MNNILKKDFTLEKNYKIISQQFGKFLSFGRRSSSAERKNLRVLKNSVYRKTSSNSKRIIFPNHLRLLENNLTNLTKNSSSSVINFHRPYEKMNDIQIIKENNITDINMIFKNREKARTFNRPPNNNSQIEIGSGINSINKIKNNQITYNNIIKIKKDKYKNNREIYKKKLAFENPALSINEVNNKTTNTKNRLLIRNNSGFNLTSNINNSGSKRNTDIMHGRQQKSELIINFNNNDIKNSRKIKLKNKVKSKMKDVLINNNYNNNELNYTMNTKMNNKSDLKQKFVAFNSFKQAQVDKNKNTNLNTLLKKKKNIDINTEFQINPIIHIYSMDKKNMHLNNKINNINNENEIINFNNTTTNKVKLKIFEINKEKENIRFTENNTILKTKSKAKVKIPDIKKESTKESKIKINNNDNTIFSKVKSKNTTKNMINDINRNNTYNNESSFFTININNSNIDENNNNEHKNNIGNYCFVSSAHDKDKRSNLNSKNEINNNVKSKNAKKINKISDFKINSNINTYKDKILQNNPTSDYIKNNLNKNFTSDNFINNKIIKEINNLFLHNQKEENNLIIQENNNINNNINIKNNNNDKAKNEEIIENKNINLLNNNEEINENEKDTFLDKSESRVIQMPPEDFIEKDDEVIKLLNNNPPKKEDNNNYKINHNEDESEILLQNNESSVINNNNYILNNQNIYQNININIFQNNNDKNINPNSKINNMNNNNNNTNINIDNTTMRDISISSNCGIRASKSLTQAGKESTGHRKKNQDNFIIEKNINNIFEFNIFAVLDGHGDNGHIISQLASKYLIKKFSSITKDFNDVESIYNFFKKSEYQKIINIFLETDAEIITKTKIDVSLSGSTCVLVLQLGEHIICANIGDSRAILIYEENGQNKIFELSHDSKPNVPEERRRIELVGGIVDQVKDETGEKTGPFRVYMKNTEQPGLAMSRSFGDTKAKSCGVIPFPDIIEYDLKYNYKYMVICSDGVWEFLSNEDVMKMGDKYFYQNDINEFCNQLLKRSTEIWEKEENYMDDITVVIVFF